MSQSRAGTDLRMTHECPCGRFVREVSPGLWIDADGGTHCYPDSTNETDAAAPHEGYDELELNQS